MLVIIIAHYGWHFELPINLDFPNTLGLICKYACNHRAQHLLEKIYTQTWGSHLIKYEHFF